MSISFATATVLAGGISTLAIFSFLIKENPVYRIFEHAFIGIATGLGVILGIRYFLWPEIISPMLGFDIDVYPDGTMSHPYQNENLWFLLPMLFGLFYYFIYSKRHSWLAKIVIGFSLGVSGGLTFKGFFAEMTPQLIQSFKPLVVFSEGNISWYSTLSNWVFVYTLLAVMYYFFFSIRIQSAPARMFSLSGRWLMMVCFGAFFGSTVMARLALLVERVQFLLVDWSDAILGVFT